MKWNLRWAAANRGIWRPSDLMPVFKEVGFTPSVSKVSALWSGTPVTVRLDDLDLICAALQCTVADLLVAEPVAGKTPVAQDEGLATAAGESPRPVPRRSTGAGRPRSLPPN
ncbi:helix-turn-helix domain-containing protein [Streptomyces sp. NPDC005794]|uniref:helix-turn-helix domain-containing protein n=1 Tax=Streptomyces TaxID=1883 RepID=UPI0029AEC294|nr:helix-turn-helix transcriptional regulator [Streptomyces scabiei]MDX3277000.1 helix-turn-helix transcriptional regulator [Streptomyces scabiei]